ncbi:MAG: hypothetical protein EGR93_02720 [Prevotella sp.]|nr:hypothetical protein [Prevotella sp.]
MRNIYLMTAALAMMAMTANAQSMKHINMNASSQNWAETSTPQKVENSTRKVATRAGSDIADNQRYINYSYDESYVWPATFPADTQGAISLGTLFYSDAFKNFEGCKIVGARFYVNIPIGASKVGICHVKIENNTPYVGDILASKEVPSTVAHWNYVWFDEPYKIDTKNFDGLLPYYDFTPSNMSADAGYPIASSGTYAGTCGALAYGDVDGKHDQSSWAWQPIYLGTDGSNLMIQLIIEKEDGNFILHDLVLDKIAMSPFVKNNTKTGLAFTCHNDGRDNITNVKFGIEVDGEKMGTFTYDKTTAGDAFREITNADYSNIPVGLPINKDWAIGEHEVTVYPVLVEGKEPEGDLTNDKLTTKFKVYKDNFDRTKNLVEFYTCQMSKYTFFADAVLTKTAKAREDDDLAIVSIHGDGQQVNEDGSVETLSDVFTVPEANKLAYYSTPSDGSAAFNRYFYDNDVINAEKALTVNMAAQDPSDQDNVVGMLNTIIKESAAYYPSFSTVGIDSKLDDATGKLTIKVMGKLINDYQKLIGDDARLTVYLTEDKIIGKQNTGGSIAKPRFTHNYVLRKIVTGTLGDALQTNGNSYENDYEVELDDAWKSKNMHIIAFVSRPMKETEKDGKTALASAMNDLWVDNTNMVAVGESDLTGISNVINWNEVKEVGRYTIDGQKLNAPTKGINLVKLSNGQTIKVIVK